MASPPPIDPYHTLGVTQDADLYAIRAAHRKLALKFHPDRIKDEAERSKGHEQFQKIQQAYELLSDPAKRSEYHDQIRLAELRKEAMTRDIPVRGPAPASFARSATFTPRDFDEPPLYDDRAPMDSYFDDYFTCRHEPVRSSARKGDGYERRKTAAFTATEKTASWTAGGIPIEIAIKLQKKAGGARERVRERETRAAAAKTRDQDRRRDAADKYRSRAAPVGLSSGSDSDTATYATVNRHRTSRATPRSEDPLDHCPNCPRFGSRRRERCEKHGDEHHGWSGHKHHDLHASAFEYIKQGAPDRPKHPNRHDSSYAYFHPTDERDDKRRDRERTKSSRGAGKSSGRPAPMPTASSDPINLGIPVERRGSTQRQRTATDPPSREHRRNAPSMPRSSTMPTGSSARRGENAASRGSNLRYGETHDSGYGSSSSPVHADAAGTSPPKYTSATRYQIREEDDKATGGHRTILVEPDDFSRPGLSSTYSRSKASRTSTSYTTRPSDEMGPGSRPGLSRRETTRSSRTSTAGNANAASQRERKPVYRPASPDDEDDEDEGRRRESSKKSSSYYYQRSDRRDDDYYPGSKYKSDLRNPFVGKRPSVY